MAIFRPPTYPVPYPHRPPLSQLWRFYTFPQGSAILMVGETVELRMYPYAGDLDDWDRVFLGGYEHEVTPEEVTILTNAGYGEYIE